MTWLAEQEGVESLQIKLNPIWGIEEVVYKGIYGYYLIPGKVNGEGFFISVCRKPDIKQEKIVLPSRKKEDSDRLGISIVDRFTVFDNPSVFRINDLVGVAATDLNTLSLLQQNLTIVKAGTAVATIKGKDMIPHHELALSVNIRKGAFPEVNLSYTDALNYLRRDQINTLSGEKGWSIIDYNGSRLGFIKNLGSRYNNYYPTDWRIRMTP
jgi:NOL1/NOP2/fmu family ribosome biogenesis protein